MFEAEQITPSPRKAYVLEALSKADLFLQPNKQIEERAQAFVNSGIKPLDALHLDFSVEAEADYFCTCDDRFLGVAGCKYDLPPIPQHWGASGFQSPPMLGDLGGCEELGRSIIHISIQQCQILKRMQDI